MTCDRFSRAEHKHGLFKKCMLIYFHSILCMSLDNIMYVVSQGHVRFYLESNKFFYCLKSMNYEL